MLGICESNITNYFPFEDTAVNLFSQPDRSDQLYAGNDTANEDDMTQSTPQKVPTDLHGCEPTAGTLFSRSV